jgi:dephospho-CoA kinase
MARGMQGELNRRLIAQIAPDADVAVDGLRHSLDVESLRSAFGSSFRLLYLESPQEARWNRKKVNDKYWSLDAFRRADSHPVEQRIESLRSSADMVLRNEGSLEDLYTTLNEAFRQFRKAGPV